METNTNTVIKFDLKEELSEKELKTFMKEAKKAKVKNLGEHFLNVTIRHPQKEKGAA